MQRFDGRVAVVTGGASGIGLALAHRFGAERMKVVIGDVEVAALDDAVRQLDAEGIDAIGVRCDVTDPAQMQALADRAVEAFGGVHVFCNNAGVGGGGLSWETPLATWEWVLGVNLWGVVHGVRSFVPLLLQHDEAHIVNTASVAGLVAAPMMGPYNASKHAVVAISETLHHEFALTGATARVSVLCPAWVRTNIATSERNRPVELGEGLQSRAAEQVQQAEMARQVLAGMIQNGMPPTEVAERVMRAIREEQFWVLTHEDDDMWMRAVNTRLSSASQRTNPQLNLLG
jgi:NAD(P)-dependent dehydrogenase (short-subunit alcohol dehydrogenase family)